MTTQPDAGAPPAAAGAAAAAGQSAPPAGTADAGAGAGAGAGQQATQSLAEQDAAKANWYDNFKPTPEAVQFIQDRKFGDFGTLVQSAMEADRLARSRNVLDMPDPEKLESWKGWEKLGWTPDRNDYQLKPPRVHDAFPKDGVFNEVSRVLRDAAHEARLPLKAAQAVSDRLFGFFSEFDQKIATATTQQLEAGKAKLQESWGADHDRNMELSRRAAQWAGIQPDVLIALEGVANYHDVMAAFHKFGAAMGEDTFVGVGAPPLPMSLDELDSQIKAIRDDKEKWRAVNNAGHRDHKSALAEYQALTQRKAEATLAAQKKGRAA